MIDINHMVEFFGWCSVINISVLGFSTLFIVLFNRSITNIHSTLLNVEPLELPKLYFKYLALYKIAILVFNLVPYLALKIMIV